MKMSWSLSVKQEPENHLDISRFHSLSLQKNVVNMYVFSEWPFLLTVKILKIQLKFVQSYKTHETLHEIDKV